MDCQNFSVDAEDDLMCRSFFMRAICYTIFARYDKRKGSGKEPFLFVAEGDRTH